MQGHQRGKAMSSLCDRPPHSQLQGLGHLVQEVCRDRTGAAMREATSDMGTERAMAWQQDREGLGELEVWRGGAGVGQARGSPGPSPAGTPGSRSGKHFR